jgi:type IV pilus assembly protein PilF
MNVRIDSLSRIATIFTVLLVLAACRSSEQRSGNDIDPVGSRPRPQQQPSPASPAERARAHTDLGVSYLQIGRFAVALQELNEALVADPSFVPAHNALGLLHMELREDDKAKASFEKALRIDPADSETNNNFGLFVCNRGKPKESIKYFLAALKNPLYATPEDSYVNAGICSRRAGDVDSAQVYFERALAAQPNDGRALVNLAQMHLERKQLNLARGYLNRYMQSIKSPDAGTLILGVRIEQALGDRSAVMSYGAQLREKFPDSPETRQFNEGKYE